MFRMNGIYGSCTDEFILAAEGSQYWCPAYEHTRGLIWLSNSNNLLIPNFLLGIGQTGISSFSGPLILCILATFGRSYLLSKSDKIQNDINKRWNKHKQVNKSFIGTCLFNAYKKYGIDNFKFKILCICFDEDTMSS